MGCCFIPLSQKHCKSNILAFSSTICSIHTVCAVEDKTGLLIHVFMKFLWQFYLVLLYFLALVFRDLYFWSSMLLWLGACCDGCSWTFHQSRQGSKILSCLSFKLSPGIGSLNSIGSLVHFPMVFLTWCNIRKYQRETGLKATM